MKSNYYFLLGLGVLGFFIQMLAAYTVNDSPILNTPLLWFIGTLLLAISLALYAQKKNYGYWMGLLAFWSLYGAVFLICMPDLSPQKNQQKLHWFFNHTTTLFCVLFGYILLICSLSNVSVWENQFSTELKGVFFAFSMTLFMLGCISGGVLEHRRIEQFNKSALWKFVAHFPILRLVLLSPPDTRDFK